jgi:hypothetical protein
LADSFYCDPLTELSQGDILTLAPHTYVDQLPPTSSEGEEIPLLVKCRQTRALVLSPDCEISNPDRSENRAVVCPVRLLSDLTPGRQGDARRHRIAHLFFLPRRGAELQDSVAILNHLTTVNMQLLLSASKIATLHVLGRKALYAQLLRWSSRWVLGEVSCPQCETRFDPSLVLPTRAPEDA